MLNKRWAYIVQSGRGLYSIEPIEWFRDIECWPDFNLISNTRFRVGVILKSHCSNYYAILVKIELWMLEFDYGYVNRVKVDRSILKKLPLKAASLFDTLSKK